MLAKGEDEREERMLRTTAMLLSAIALSMAISSIAMAQDGRQDLGRLGGVPPATSSATAKEPAATSPPATSTATAKEPAATSTATAEEPAATGSTAQDPSAKRQATSAASASLISLDVRCVLVRDHSIAEWFRGDSKKRLPGVCHPLEHTSPPLIGVGQLIIAVNANSFKGVSDAGSGDKGKIVLFLNGVQLDQDAKLLAHDQVDDLVALRYQIRQGKETQRLWSMLYADGDMTEPQTLHVALAWVPNDTEGQMHVPKRSNAKASIAITTLPQQLIAIALVVLTAAVVIIVGRNTDVLRDASVPKWWLDAAKHQQIANHDLSTQDAYLQKIDSTYISADKKMYLKWADLLLARYELSAQEQKEALLGLALRTDEWKPVRASYSLSRTQIAMWFAFTVAAALFLWTLYGDLRRIDNSLLYLLGISAGTAGVSWAADRRANGRPYLPSGGFWNDLLTDFENRRRAYRYQAVVVNILLLVVGSYHLVQHLEYPVFDPTWLIFLTISGSTYGLGKHVLESK